MCKLQYALTAHNSQNEKVDRLHAPAMKFIGKQQLV